MVSVRATRRSGELCPARDDARPPTGEEAGVCPAPVLGSRGEESLRPSDRGDTAKSVQLSTRDVEDERDAPMPAHGSGAGIDLLIEREEVPLDGDRDGTTRWVSGRVLCR